MGDRVNVKFVVEDEPPIFFYSHWGGYNAAVTVKKALARKERWTDPSYLARIIFCEMLSSGIKDDATRENRAEAVLKRVEDPTGYGISTEACDEENSTIVVDTKNQTVTLRDLHYPFEAFIELTDTVAVGLHQRNED